MRTSLWNTLVIDNPMLIEISRFRRRFFSFSGSRGMNNGVLALAMICYAGFVMVVVSWRGDVPPMTLICAQTVLLALIAPSMLHGAIAGERERRSWDLLLVAPISKAQLVAGKFIGALSAIALGVGLFSIPTLISAATYQKSNFYDLMLAEGVSISFTILVASLTLLLSARVKRSFMALGATIGVLALGLLVLPMLFTTLMGYDRFSTEVVMYLHPVMPLMHITQEIEGYVDQNPPLAMSLFGIPHILFYLAMSAILLGWAERTLSFADNEVKFIQKTKIDA